MSLQTDEARELEALQKVETTIRRREKRERLHHIIIAALGALLVASVLTGHCPHRKRK